MAQPFRFRLDVVLDIRKRAERECALRLAEVQRELRACESRISGLEKESRELINLRRSHRSTPHADAGQFVQAEHYGVRLRRILSALQEQRAEIQSRVDLRREELVKASQAAKALERLRERRHRQYLDAVNRKEAATNDEVGQLLHQRRVPLVSSGSAPG